MSIRRKDTTVNATKQWVRPEVIRDITELDICSCPPISSLCLQRIREQGRETQGEDDEAYQLLPTPPKLNMLLRTRVQSLLPSSASFSILLLHVSQLEDIHITSDTEVLHKRKRYHPSESVVEQILANVRRAVRAEDTVYLDTGKGAAILFPNVDQQGAYTILERVYNNVNLLQAETIVPPLTCETDIVLSIASYPEQGQCLEEVLACAGRVMRRLTLRPAITPHLWDTMPPGESILPFLDLMDSSLRNNRNTPASPLAPSSTIQDTHQQTSPVPFLQLPTTLSKRLKNLLPYKVAMQFRCIPVGRDHNRLTLAMANPTDTVAISTLHERTGMSIFPVACDKDALEALLTERW